VDPITLLATATAAYNALKKGIAVGKEMQHMAQDLGNLWASLAGLTRAAAKPKRKGLFQDKQSFESEAIKIYAAKAKAQQMAAEIKNAFVSEFGLNAWDQVQSEVINIRKQQAELQREEAEAAEELKSNIIFGISLLGGGILMAAILVFAIFITAHRG
jgi:hypothetical protein